jgi:alpha-amylase
MVTVSTNGTWNYTDNQTDLTSLFYRLYHPYPPAQVIMQGFMLGPQWIGRDASGNSLWETNSTWAVPCPYDAYSIGGIPSSWWYDTVAKNANLLASNGFTAIWLPAPRRATSDQGVSSNPIRQFGGIFDPGYGSSTITTWATSCRTDYQTRYGSREQLNRCVAMLRANGLSVCRSCHQPAQFPNIANPVGPAYQWFQYKDAYGNSNGGRFPSTGRIFIRAPVPSQSRLSRLRARPVSSRNHLPGRILDGSVRRLWGPDFAPICGQMMNGSDVYCDVELKKWGDWLLNATGIQGYRLDACSGISWQWLARL